MPRDAARAGGGRSTHQRIDLLVELVRRELRVRFRRSRFGFAWAQAAPLAQFAVLAVVFTRVVPIGVRWYPAFLLVGLLVWQWFAASLRAATDSIVSARDLARRPGVPVWSLPFAAVASQLVVFGTALPVLFAVVLAVTGRIPWTAVSVPAVVVVQIVFVLGPAWALAAAHGYAGDVGHAVGVVLLPLFYATPVLYPPDSVPGGLAWVHQLNPVAHLLAAYRGALVEGVWPSPTALLAVLAVGVAGACLGWRVLVRAVPGLVERL